MSLFLPGSLQEGFPCYCYPRLAPVTVCEFSVKCVVRIICEMSSTKYSTFGH